MAKKKKIRSFCVGKDIVLIDEEQIISIQVSEARLMKEIDNQVLFLKPSQRRPSFLFGKAIAAVTAVPFAAYGFQYQGKGIHESECFQRWLPYLQEKLNTEGRMKRNQEERIAQRQLLKEEGEYLSYKSMGVKRQKDFIALKKKKNGFRKR